MARAALVSYRAMANLRDGSRLLTLPTSPAQWGAAERREAEGETQPSRYYNEAPRREASPTAGAALIKRAAPVNKQIRDRLYIAPVP